MPAYVMLSTLTPEGRKTLHDRPDRLAEVNREIEDFGCKIVGQYSVLGPYDFVTILEAPDNETAAHLSVDLGSRHDPHRHAPGAPARGPDRQAQGRSQGRPLLIDLPSGPLSPHAEQEADEGEAVGGDGSFDGAEPLVPIPRAEGARPSRPEPPARPWA